jgi:hypothetical protein
MILQARALFTLLIFCLLASAPLRGAAPISAPPQNHIQDSAHVLLPEAAARVSRELVDKAQTGSTYIYVVTVASLNVLPSLQKDRLETVAREYGQAWLADKVGAIILFDDEGGLMTVAPSAATEQKFTSLEIELALGHPLREAQREGLSRDKLERAAFAVSQVLGDFQARALRDEKRQRVANITMAVIALLGVALAVWSALAPSKPDTTAEPTTE